MGLGGTEGDRRSTGVPPSPAAAAGEGGVRGQPVRPAAASRRSRGAWRSPCGDGSPPSTSCGSSREAEACQRARPARGVAAARRVVLLAPDDLAAATRRKAPWTPWSPNGAAASRQPVNPLTAENERLQRENERLAARLRQAEMIIDVQKKVSEILGTDSAATERKEHLMHAAT